MPAVTPALAPREASSVLDTGNKGVRHGEGVRADVEAKAEDIEEEDESDKKASPERRVRLKRARMAWLTTKVARARIVSQRIMRANPWKEAKRKKDAKMAELRERCVVELGLNRALDQHWKDCDKIMRQVDAKDSIFELERIRKVLLGRFEERSVQPMEARYPGKRSRRDAKLLQADIDKLVEPVKDFDSFDNLKRLYYAAAAMDMYQRHNHELHKKILRKHRDAFYVKQRLRSEIEEVEAKVERARREKWCAEDLHLWEPHRLPNAERKRLAKDGGPRSLDLFNERCEESSGMARLVRELQVAPVAYEIVSLGQTYSDSIAASF